MWNYEEELKKAEEYAEIQRQKREINEILHQYDEPKKPLTTSKKLTIFALADCVVIQLFAMFAMLHMNDISALYSLIAIVGTVVCEVFSLASYNHKSMRENTEGGIIYQDMENQHEQIMGIINKTEEESCDGKCSGCDKSC